MSRVVRSGVIFWASEDRLKSYGSTTNALRVDDSVRVVGDGERGVERMGERGRAGVSSRLFCLRSGIVANGKRRGVVVERMEVGERDGRRARGRAGRKKERQRAAWDWIAAISMSITPVRLRRQDRRPGW